MFHPQELQEFDRLILRARLPVECERQHHVLHDGQSGDEVEVLEYISECLPPDLCQVPFRKALSLIEDRSACQAKLPGSGVVKTAQKVDQGGFARS